MQRPRHSHFVQAAWRLSVVLVAMVALAGCRNERGGAQESGAAQYQRMLDSSGRRILVVDAAGEPVAKFRERSDQYKVYDENLMPLGFVRWQPAPGAGDSPAIVSVRPVEGDVAQSIEAVSDDSYELNGRFRIEQTDRGWAVFDPAAELVGVFQRHSDGGWQLRQSYEDEKIIDAEQSAQNWALVRDGETIVEVRVGELSELELLAAKLDGLSLLDRAAIGAWMHHARPPASAELGG